MIRVDQTLCAGCGVCVPECPTGAITQREGIVLVDAALCNGCGSLDEAHARLCIDVCPEGALTWVAETVPELATAPSSLAVIKPPARVVHVETQAAVPWRRALIPAMANALIWVGRELVPRLVPLALDRLDSALDRWPSRWVRGDDLTPVSTRGKPGRALQQRRRHRRRRAKGRTAERRNG